MEQNLTQNLLKQVGRNQDEVGEILNELITLSPLPIVLMDVSELAIKYVNPAFVALTGYTFSDLENASIYRIFPKDSVEYTRSKITEHVTNQGGEENDIRLLKKNGEVRFCNIAISFISKNNQPFLAGFFTDVTQQKRNIESLEWSQLRKNRIQKLAKLSDWQIEVKSELMYMSTESQQCLGIALGESKFALDEYVKVVHPFDRKRYLNHVYQSLATHEGYSIEYRVLDKFRSERYLLERAEFYCDTTTNTEYLLGYTQDITAVKLAEIAFMRIRQKLNKILSFSNVGFWEYELKTNRLTFSREALKILDANDFEYSFELNNLPRYLAKIDFNYILERFRKAAILKKEIEISTEITTIGRHKKNLILVNYFDNTSNELDVLYGIMIQN